MNLDHCSPHSCWLPSRWIFLACSIVTCLLSVGTAVTSHAVVTMNWATVGNPGNASDSADGNNTLPGVQNLGSVATTYKIATELVTNGQYAEFLNAVDLTGADPHELYGPDMGVVARGGISFISGNASGSKYVVRTDMGNKPVNFVNWFDSARFANWMHNGQGTGSTETGAYDMSSGVPVRLGGASVFLPSENEWYKAAYFDPVNAGADANGNADYWLYPTMSDTVPTMGSASAIGSISNPGANVANYNMGADWNGQDGNVTTVGSATSMSFYGATDMAGNLWEWTEGLQSGRVVRGGSWQETSDWLRSSDHGIFSPAVQHDQTGFRLASVPEPTTGVSILVALGLLGLKRRREH